MNNFGRLALICLMLATGLALGIARGQLPVPGVTALCSGMTVTVESEGAPAKANLLCPDMAPLSLASVDLPPPAATLAPGRFERVGCTSAAAQAERPVATTRARGPPQPFCA